MRTLMQSHGTGPEAIKMAPIVSALQKSPNYECVATVTGQHRQMLDQVNELYGIVPVHDLNIIQPRNSLTGIMTRTLEGRTNSFVNISRTP